MQVGELPGWLRFCQMVGTIPSLRQVRSKPQASQTLLASYHLRWPPYNNGQGNHISQALGEKKHSQGRRSDQETVI